MPKHNVYFSLPEKEMGNVDAHFSIYRDKEKLGLITISKGGLDYYPYKKRNPITLSWTEFDEVISKVGKK